MSAKHATVVLALTGALILAGTPSQAQSRHHGGGGYHGGGGGHAVPRGSGGGGRPHGGMAGARHPSPGSGYHGGHGYGHGHYGYGYGHGHYGYGHGYYGYGYGWPYYYGGYYGYYGPSFGLSLSFGWPYYGYWGSAYAGYPNGYAYAGDYAPSYGYEARLADAPPRVERSAPRGARPRASDGETGRVRLEVRPEDASVYVDDAFWGTARDTKILNLPAGHHSIELVRPGFTPVSREAEVASGEARDVMVELIRP